MAISGGRRQQPRQAQGADRNAAVVDDEDFPEVGGGVDGRLDQRHDLADAAALGDRDELALHQAAGGFLGVAERGFDIGAIGGGQRGKDALLLVVLEILDDGDGVVGVELGEHVGDGAGRHGGKDVLADIVVEFGDDLGIEGVADGAGERGAVVLGDHREEFGDVGGAQRGNEGADGVVIGGIECGGDVGDEAAGEATFLERLAGGVGVGGGGLGHRRGL